MAAEQIKVAAGNAADKISRVASGMIRQWIFQIIFEVDVISIL